MGNWEMEWGECGQNKGGNARNLGENARKQGWNLVSYI